MEYRQLTSADATAFRTLRLDGLLEAPTAFLSTYDEESGESVEAIAPRLEPSEDGAVLGAFDGRTLVGVAGIRREARRKLSHKAILWGVHVARTHRRRGVGKGLIRAALVHAFRELGIRQVNLGVNAVNRPAIALYESLGFKSFGIERDYMLVEGKFYDELHMVCFERAFQERGAEAPARSDALEDDGDALAHADAHRREA